MFHFILFLYDFCVCAFLQAPPEGIRLKNEKKLTAEKQEQYNDDDNDETDSISNNDQVDNVEEEVKKERKSARKSVSKKKSNVEE